MIQIKIAADDLEAIAFRNPGALIAFESDRAVLELGGVEFVADLPKPGRAS